MARPDLFLGLIFGVAGEGFAEGFGDSGRDAGAGAGVSLEDVLVEHGAEKDGHGGVEIEAGGELGTALGTAKDALDALAARFHDAVSPGLAELMVCG